MCSYWMKMFGLFRSTRQIAVTLDDSRFNYKELCMSPYMDLVTGITCYGLPKVLKGWGAAAREKKGACFACQV